MMYDICRYSGALISYNKCSVMISLDQFPRSSWSGLNMATPRDRPERKIRASHKETGSDISMDKCRYTISTKRYPAKRTKIGLTIIDVHVPDCAVSRVIVAFRLLPSGLLSHSYF